MNTSLYIKLNTAISKKKWVVSLIRFLDKAITYITAISYAVLLIWLFLHHEYYTVFQFIQLPAVAFIIVSIFRKLYSAKRPYEIYGFEPVIEKETKGKSFPSRHVFSIFMIAMVFTRFCLPLGLFFLFLGLVLAILRVVGGVHFIRDVFSGAAIAIFAGYVGLFLI